MPATLIIFFFLIVFALIVVFRSVRVIQQGLVGVVKRLGQFHSVRNPGITFLVPFIDNMEVVDMRETPRTGDRQDVITKDNVSVAVNATIFSQVVDPRLALFQVSNYFIAVDQLSRTTLRAVFGSMSLDEALSQREQINAQLQMQMEQVTDKWGIRINRIEIVDIVPPQQILMAMALQKQADQEKRAAILQSEGQQQSAINVDEGEPCHRGTEGEAHLLAHSQASQGGTRARAAAAGLGHDRRRGQGQRGAGPAADQQVAEDLDRESEGEQAEGRQCQPTHQQT